MSVCSGGSGSGDDDDDDDDSDGCAAPAPDDVTCVVCSLPDSVHSGKKRERERETGNGSGLKGWCSKRGDWMEAAAASSERRGTNTPHVHMKESGPGEQGAESVSGSAAPAVAVASS